MTTTVFITLMQNVQAYLKMIVSTFKEQPLWNTWCSFTTETCCEHTEHTGIQFTSITKQETDQMSCKTLHILCQLFSFLIKTFWETRLPRNWE